MRLISVFFTLALLSCSASAECEKLAAFSKRVNEVIEIELEKRDGYDLFAITFPSEIDGLHFNNAELEKGCNKSGTNTYSIPLLTYDRGRSIDAVLLMPEDQAREWRVHVSYFNSLQQGEEIMLDGPALESWQVLQHNKKRNEMDGSVEPPIR